MTTWASLGTWGAWGSWPFSVTGPGFPQLPNPVVITAYAAGRGDLTPLVYGSATMRPLSRVSSSMLRLGSAGATVGPVSASASGITVRGPSLAPGSRMVDITRVVGTVAGVDVTVQPTTVPPLDGIPVFYGPDTPTHVGPFLWIAVLDPLTIYYEDGA